MIAKIYTEIPANIITVFHAQKKTSGKSRKIVDKILKFLSIQLLHIEK
jgi:hypothetical protein